VLVVDDGSTDGTGRLLALRDDVRLISHAENRGYGAALATAFRYAVECDYEFIVTIDCDGQHEPQRIPRFVSACQGVDIVSGSRYLKRYPLDNEPPAQRRWVNQLITHEVNERLGLALTDAFCGFKAYRVAPMTSMEFVETGYAMPLELWVRAAAAGLKIVEIPVPLIYLDEKRSFGGALDDAATRLEYYRRVLNHSIDALCAGQQLACREGRCEHGAG
jgi:dolichol-phosphate mannosyltransferase